MTKATITIRVDPDLKRWYKELVATKTFKNLTEVFETALVEFKAKYTGEPTIMELDRRTKVTRSRLDQIEEQMRNLRRALDEAS